MTRPILSELWSIFYKHVPREQRETYEEFFNRMQGLTNEIVRDPASVELDAFSKKVQDKVEVPGRNAASLIIDDHVEMARSPYEDMANEMAAIAA